MPQMKSELCASVCIGETDGKEEEERDRSAYLFTLADVIESMHSERSFMNLSMNK